MKTRVRELADGCYVAEVKRLFGWHGIYEWIWENDRSLRTEPIGEYDYYKCIRKEFKDAEALRLQYLANHGIGKHEGEE